MTCGSLVVYLKLTSAARELELGFLQTRIKIESDPARSGRPMPITTPDTRYCSTNSSQRLKRGSALQRRGQDMQKLVRPLQHD
jgi:hypothetical protein